MEISCFVEAVAVAEIFPHYNPFWADGCSINRLSKWLHVAGLAQYL